MNREPEKTSRAGRNLPAAIGVGVALGAAVILSLVFYKAGFIVIVVAALIGGTIEIAGAFAHARIRVPIGPVILGGIVMLAGAYTGGMEVSAVALALTVIGILLWRLSEGSDGFVRDTAGGMFLLAYLWLMGCFVMMMLAESDGAWRIIAFIIAAITSDIGGYTSGVFFGRHPMAPSISPKKSWEGLAGSLVLGMACGIAVVYWGLDGRWWVGIVLGVVSVLMATLGDLCESLIKRDLGIKDMGNLLPGHGGLMDRLDSLVVVAPLAWLVLHLLVSAPST